MKFYRYEAHVFAELDTFGDFVSPKYPIPKIVLYEYNLHKETPKGYWIGYGHPDNGYIRGVSRWVSKSSKRRYAYPTKKEALINFIKRTERRVRILKAGLDQSEFALMEAKQIKIDE